MGFGPKPEDGSARLLNGKLDPTARPVYPPEENRSWYGDCHRIGAPSKRPHFPGLPPRSPPAAAPQRFEPSRVSTLWDFPFLVSDRNPTIVFPVRVHLPEMARVYVGNLDPRVTERELEDEFRAFGVLRSVWVARKPPGFAFIDFDDRRDAQDAVREVDGKNGWRVEISRRGGGRSLARDRSGGSDMKCYECGESGHFARECRLRIGSRGLGSGRRRSPSPRYRRSPSYGRSPRDRSPRRRSVSPPRRSYSRSRSPPYKHGREESPYANGNSDARDERRSKS